MHENIQPQSNNQPSRDWRTSASKLPALIYVIVIVAFIKSHFSLLDFPLDDAWIHQVYARSFAFGHGFAYNPGQQEAGSTSPLWAILTAPAHWLSFAGSDATTLAIKLIGVLLGLACVWIVQRIACGLLRSRFAGCCAAVLFAVDPRLLFSALSGMETCLTVVLILGACLALSLNRPLLFLISLSLAPTARPEALLLLPLVPFGLATCLHPRPPLLQIGLASLISAIPMGLWSCFCLSVTGRLLPNTYYVKSEPFALSAVDLRTGLDAVMSHGVFPQWLFWAGLAVFVLFCLKRGRESLPALALLFGAAWVYTFGVIGSRHVMLEGYYWTRWTDPAALLLQAACACGTGGLLALLMERVHLARVPAGQRSLRMTLWGARIALAALVSVLSVTLYRSFSERRARLSSDCRAISIVNVMMGKWLASNTPPDAVVGVCDAGAVRYFGNRQTIDFGGLNHAEIAFKRITLKDAVAKTDFLAVFPRLFDRRLADDFSPCMTITIPQNEYTISPTPNQTLHVAFRRNRPGTADRNRPLSSIPLQK